MLAAAGTLLGRRLRWPAPAREHWRPAGRSRSRREAAEAEVDAPVFQYVGERAARADRVFVWGFSFSGALGVPSFVVPASGPEPRAGLRPRRRIQPVPYRLELDHKISSAACGYGFTLLSSKTKDITKVWGMGLNKDSQLGFHRSRKDKSKQPGAMSMFWNPRLSRCPSTDLRRRRCCSESHRVHRMQDFDGQVVQVVCGQDHSLFLTDRGEVYSCGWGADGQTGLGHYNITSTPTKLGGDLAGVTVVQVATYGDCCLAVSSDGGIFGWGNSEYLQLASVTDSTQVNVPRCLPFSEVGKVKQAACGGTGCAVLNEEGHVFVWGYGILGKGPNLLETALPEMIPPTLFGLTEFNPDVQVSQIRCGLSHFAALTNKGELFVWGKNIRGCLGIGRLEDQYFPWRVMMPGEPVDMACGVDHMVTLAKSFI
ncbi:RCC1-like G exchanging factor-like protein isoform X2 [Peromyscus californicus insignis]|uniref:RCC1-like G exchanging factor-like protein isoform X2 n=1 Tax=Peromyscus californicus insignis TaxID=564181 RepID=UPI0022A72710|nr:RCC1-like G exchanging factor-like protein isoform X2 [Peromyscus californicus insignis]